MQVTSTTSVAAPIDAVWDTLSDHVGMSTWARVLTVTIERAGTEQPNGVGTIRRLATAGPAPAIFEEITAFDPPHTLGYRALSGIPIRGYRAEVHLTPEGSADTRIDYTCFSTSTFPLVKVALAGLNRLLLRLLARAAVRSHRRS